MPRGSKQFSPFSSVLLAKSLLSLFISLRYLCIMLRRSVEDLFSVLGVSSLMRSSFSVSNRCNVWDRTVDSTCSGMLQKRWDRILNLQRFYYSFFFFLFFFFFFFLRWCNGETRKESEHPNLWPFDLLLRVRFSWKLETKLEKNISFSEKHGKNKSARTETNLWHSAGFLIWVSVFLFCFFASTVTRRYSDKFRVLEQRQTLVWMCSDGQSNILGNMCTNRVKPMIFEVLGEC